MRRVVRKVPPGVCRTFTACVAMTRSPMPMAADALSATPQPPHNQPATNSTRADTRVFVAIPILSIPQVEIFPPELNTPRLVRPLKQTAAKLRKAATTRQ